MFTRHSKRSILMVLLAALASLPTLAESQTTLCFDRNGIVYVKEMKTGNVQEVGQGTDPHISPAGNLVVYTIAVGIVDRVIAVVDPASNQAKIYVGPQTLRQWNAQWSPDGKWLAFQGMEGRDSSGREGPVLLDPETGEWRFLAVRSEGKSMYFSSWRPDSKAILVHDMFTLFQIDLNGRIVHSAKIEDMNGRDVAGSCRFLVSPDGNMVIFDDIALPDAEKFPQTMAIYAYSFSEKKRIRLTPQGLSAAQPLWYKPGDEIIFTGTEAATPNVYRLWLADRKPVCIMKNAVSGSVGNVAEKK